MGSLDDLLSVSGSNSGFVQELYELYEKDPSLVGTQWAELFSTINSNGHSNGHALAYGSNGDGHKADPLESGPISTNALDLQSRVSRLIDAYRRLGHLKAKINPLSHGVMQLPESPELDVDRLHFSSNELATSLRCEGLSGRDLMPVSEVIETLTASYCGSVGFEFAHLTSEEERVWLQSHIEKTRPPFTVEQKKRAFQKLVEAEEFEAQLHKKYVGQKRFSLQGGETLIPMLDFILDESGRLGVKEVVMGKAHRGRLNVLCNIVGKPIEDLFTEFEDQSLYSVLGAGDVKYHKGYRSTYHATSGALVKMMLAPNPSHLEFVNPVVEGIVRAKQDLEYQSDRAVVLPVLMHGDAAFVGQGVVPETLNLSRVEGYKTGGTIHIIINNQIGFTTNPEEGRSSTYSSEWAKAVQAPIFHVNGENVEASLWVSRLALEFRLKFQRDVVIDLYCYRKYGHNEGDDPSFTQPLAYAEIQAKKSVPHLYGDYLVASGVYTPEERDGAFTEYATRFQSAHNARDVKSIGEACPMFGRLRIPTPSTGVKKDILKKIAKTLVTYPEGFKPHPKLQAILEKRVKTLDEGQGIDWGFAEALAYGSLVLDGHPVRLSGQDCGRGTFSHRHLLLSDYENGARFSPLTELSDANSPVRFEVINSTLSEAAVLGFEFGYSATAPKSLVLWEAQFGDFANGAQVYMDQFISSSEVKWDQLSGVTLLLPHGFEGQGPEHSSARLERYLQLCAEGNMVVCYPSNAAQQFHLLRRQGLLELKRPLVVMTPKSLLRLPDACGSVDAFTSGQFEPVLEDTFVEKGEPYHVVMLTGKVYYDVIGALKKLKKPSVKVIRIEQLHPFPQFELKRALKGLNPKSFIWVQEEPQNMGAWTYLESYLREKFEQEPIYVGRSASASPATGSAKHHAAEQQRILQELLALVEK